MTTSSPTILGQKQRKQRNEPVVRFLWKAIPLTLLLVVPMLYGASRFTLMIDEQKEVCLPPYRVFLLDRDITAVERGKLLFFFAQGMTPFFHNGTKVVKRVEGLPGDHYKADESGLWVNGTLVAKGWGATPVLKTTWKDYARQGVIPTGNYLVVGDHERSFDSRYWGFVRQPQLQGGGYAVF